MELLSGSSAGLFNTEQASAVIDDFIVISSEINKPVFVNEGTSTIIINNLTINSTVNSGNKIFEFINS